MYMISNNCDYHFHFFSLEKPHIKRSHTTVLRGGRGVWGHAVPMQTPGWNFVVERFPVVISAGRKSSWELCFQLFSFSAEPTDHRKQDGQPLALLAKGEHKE